MTHSTNAQSLQQISQKEELKRKLLGTCPKATPAALQDFRITERSPCVKGKCGGLRKQPVAITLIIAHFDLASAKFMFRLMCDRLRWANPTNTKISCFVSCKSAGPARSHHTIMRLHLVRCLASIQCLSNHASFSTHFNIYHSSPCKKCNASVSSC